MVFAKNTDTSGSLLRYEGYGNDILLRGIVMTHLATTRT